MKPIKRKYVEVKMAWWVQPWLSVLGIGALFGRPVSAAAVSYWKNKGTRLKVRQC